MPSRNKSSQGHYKTKADVSKTPNIKKHKKVDYLTNTMKMIVSKEVSSRNTSKSPTRSVSR